MAGDNLIKGSESAERENKENQVLSGKFLEDAYKQGDKVGKIADAVAKPGEAVITGDMAAQAFDRLSKASPELLKAAMDGFKGSGYELHPALVAALSGNDSVMKVLKTAYQSA